MPGKPEEQVDGNRESIDVKDDEQEKARALSQTDYLNKKLLASYLQTINSTQVPTTTDNNTDQPPTDDKEWEM